MTQDDSWEIDEGFDDRPPYNALNLTVVPIERFIFVVRAISDNKLWGAVRQHLKSQGCDTVALSAEPITAIQELLYARRAADGPEGSPVPPRPQPRPQPRPRPRPQQSQQGTSDRRLDRFLASGCGQPPPHYPPRPPDDWPEGPWDPPQHLEE